jgi:aspartate/methionine/tyrosine aminotransferase
MKLDLGFGNSVCVRKAFLETYHGNMIIFTRDRLSTFDYPAYGGDQELIEITKQVIKRQTGIEKKYVFLTNGATGAVTIGLRALKQRGAIYCHTRNAPWYLRYPSMIKAADLMHVDENRHIDPKESVILLDIPSNPLGIIHGISKSMLSPMLLDGVYLNKIYTSGCFIPIPAHDILAGSYSKLLGINGIRVGWIATNDDLLSERIRELLMGEYCGLGIASQEIIKNALYDFDWESFEKLAKGFLDDNRGQWSKLEKFFHSWPVRDEGMFHYSKIDAKCNKLLQKAGINWTTGSSLGTDDSYGRFNLGQDVDVIRKAVNAILKADKIK